MSRIKEVIRNKKKIEKAISSRKRSEIIRLRQNTMFKARAIEELKRIDLLLSDKDVEKVIIEVPKDQMSRFSEVIYSSEFSGYDIKQLMEKPNCFYIGKKYINL